MKQLNIGNSGLMGSEISLGLMRIADLSPEKAVAVIASAHETGINFYDHADIYGAGKSEEVFAVAAKTYGLKREDMVLQTKCGIRKGQFDFSKEHILNSVEGSLKRLDTDYVDVLLLHRPDTLMEPEEIAEAFTKLHSTGKVKHFGVSNFTPMQTELLQKYLDKKLIANQMQFGPMHTPMVDFGITANMADNYGIERTGSVLEYCRLHDITIQAWSPFAYSTSWTIFVDDPKHPEINACLDTLAEQYGVDKNAIITSWILRHPAKMQVVIGTMTPERITAIAKGIDITLTREEWYRVYLAAGNKLP